MLDNAVTEETFVGWYQAKDEVNLCNARLTRAKVSFQNTLKPLWRRKAWEETKFWLLLRLCRWHQNQIKDLKRAAKPVKKRSKKPWSSNRRKRHRAWYQIVCYLLWRPQQEKCFMADNVWINQATPKMIVDPVAEEAAKKQQRGSWTLFR